MTQLGNLLAVYANENFLIVSKSQSTFTLQQLGDIFDSFFSKNGILGHFWTPNGVFDSQMLLISLRLYANSTKIS